MNKNIFSAILFIGILSLPLASFALEEDPAKKVATKEDTLGIYELENKVPNDIVFPKDQVQDQIKETPKPAAVTNKSSNTTTQSSGKVAEENPNSVMSFNFIYYIIDTFKFTDPLD